MELADDKDDAAVELDCDGREGAAAASEAGGAGAGDGAAAVAAVGVREEGGCWVVEGPEGGGDGALAAEDAGGEAAGVHEEAAGRGGEDGGADEVGEVGAEESRDSLCEEEGGRRGDDGCWWCHSQGSFPGGRGDCASSCRGEGGGWWGWGGGLEGQQRSSGRLESVVGGAGFVGKWQAVTTATCVREALALGEELVLRFEDGRELAVMEVESEAPLLKRDARKEKREVKGNKANKRWQAYLAS